KRPSPKQGPSSQLPHLQPQTKKRETEGRGASKRAQHPRRPSGRRGSARGLWSEEEELCSDDERGGSAPLKKPAKPQNELREGEARGVTRRAQHPRRPSGRRGSARGLWSEEKELCSDDERGGAAPLKK